MKLTKQEEDHILLELRRLFKEEETLPSAVVEASAEIEFAGNLRLIVTLTREAT